MAALCFALFLFETLFAGLLAVFVSFGFYFSWLLFLLALMAGAGVSSFDSCFPFARTSLVVGPLSFPCILWGQVTGFCFSWVNAG